MHSPLIQKFNFITLEEFIKLGGSFEKLQKNILNEYITVKYCGAVTEFLNSGNIISINRIDSVDCYSVLFSNNKKHDKLHKSFIQLKIPFVLENKLLK